MSRIEIKSELNQALLTAFISASAQWLPNIEPHEEKLIEFLGRTELPLDQDPQYHRVAVEFLESLWSSNFLTTEYEDLLVILRQTESFFRKKKPQEKLRDHIVHTALVFLTGLHLILSCRAFQQIFESTKNLLDLWYWAASWHDLGYPAQLYQDGNLRKIELFRRILEIDRSSVTSSALESGAPKYEDILITARRQGDLYKEVESQVEAFSSEGFFSQEKPCAHAKVSALASIISASRKRSTEDRHKLRVLKNVEMPIAAIALHDCESGLLRSPIQFEQNPILWLLVFCDEIQHWNRPSRGHRHNLVPSEVFIEVEEESKIVVDYRLNEHDKDRKQKEIERTYKNLRKKILPSNECSFSILIDGEAI